MVATPSDPQAWAFIRAMLSAASYTLAETQRRGRYVRRVFVRPVDDNHHLELWQYADDRARVVLFFDLLLWRRGEHCAGKAVRYVPIRNDLTDVFGAFSDEKTGIGTLSRELSSRTTGTVKRRAYKYAPDARRLGFDDNGGSSPSEALSSRVA
jgi:hypothetical protein